MPIAPKSQDMRSPGNPRPWPAHCGYSRKPAGWIHLQLQPYSHMPAGYNVLCLPRSNYEQYQTQSPVSIASGFCSNRPPSVKNTITLCDPRANLRSSYTALLPLPATMKTCSCPFSLDLSSPLHPFCQHWAHNHQHPQPPLPPLMWRPLPSTHPASPIFLNSHQLPRHMVWTQHTMQHHCVSLCSTTYHGSLIDSQIHTPCSLPWNWAIVGWPCHTDADWCSKLEPRAPAKVWLKTLGWICQPITAQFQVKDKKAT